jgi:hypothetical protein
MKAHPEVQCVWNDPNVDDYSTTTALNGVLVTREFNFDVFRLSNINFDYQQIMSKGYCVDLSESEVIRGELNKMHPSIAAQAMRDGKIYAIPVDISFQLFICDERGWEAAGLTDKDVPTSFPAFLDFLEAWLARIEKNPEYNISINNHWDETLYNEHTYTEWLVGMLIDNYIMQRQYVGEPVRFDNEELIQLLGRAKEIGDDIYQAEPTDKGEFQLFDSFSCGGWPGNVASRLVSLRLNEKLPKLVPAYLSMYAINSASEEKALSLELMESIASHIKDLPRALLFKDAEPVRNPNFEKELEGAQANVTECEEKLKDPAIKTDEKYSLQDRLENYKHILESVKGREYSLSQERLQDYQSFAGSLYFPVPGTFFIATDEGQNLKKLEARYAAGNLTAKEFVKQLDHTAQVVELENGQ